MWLRNVLICGICLFFVSFVYGGDLPTCGLQHPSTLRIDLGKAAGGFDPQLAESFETTFMFQNMVGLGYRVAANGSPVPGLLKLKSLSRDGLTAVFKVREGARWSFVFADGTTRVAGPVTSYDFKTSLKRSLSPLQKAVYAYVLDFVKNAHKVRTMPITSLKDKELVQKALDTLGIETPDSKTLVLKLAQPTPQLLDMFTLPISLPLYKNLPFRDKDHRVLDLSDLSKIPTSGPYAMVYGVRKDIVVACKNKNYLYVNPHAPERLIFLLKLSSKEALQGWEASYAQWKSTGHPDTNPYHPDVTATVPVGTYRHLLARYGRASVHAYPGNNTYSWAFNTKSTLLHGKRGLLLRTLVNILIDRDKLVKDLGGTSVALKSYLPGGRLIRGMTPVLPFWQNVSYKTRQALALKLLKDLKCSATHPVHLKFITNENPFHEKVFRLVKEQLKKGTHGCILLSMHTMTWEALLSTRRLGRGDTQIFRAGWAGDNRYALTYLKTLLSNNSENASHYSNPLYDNIIYTASQLPSSHKDRRLLMEWALTFVQEHYPLIPLLQLSFPRLVSPIVRGYKDNVLGRVAAEFLSIAPSYHAG